MYKVFNYVQVRLTFGQSSKLVTTIHGRIHRSGNFRGTDKILEHNQINKFGHTLGKTVHFLN